MLTTDGIDGTFGVTAVTADFTLALWFRFDQAVSDYGTLVGRSGVSPVHVIRADLDGVTGYLGVRLEQAGSAFVAELAGYAVDDNVWHLLVIVRSGTTVRTYVDGRPLTVSVNALPSADFVGGAIAIGGLYQEHLFGAPPTIDNPTVIDCGQWGVWDVALGEAEVLHLASGMSFGDTANPPVEHWKFYDANLELPLGATGDPAGAFDHESMAAYGLFSMAGAAPIEGVDRPIRILASNLTSVLLAEAELGMTANSLHFLGICPFNLAGFDSMTVLSFPTDAAARPVTVPATVRITSIRPLAGGYVLVGWTYEEVLGFAYADRFRLAFEALSGQAPVADALVMKVARENSLTVGPLADGAWRVRVYSERATKFNSAVTGAEVRADATPPAIGVDNLEVV